MMIGDLKLIRAKGRGRKIEVLLSGADYRITMEQDANRWERTGPYGTPLALPVLKN